MKEQIFMKMAKDLAEFSKCISLKVGCLIVNERDRIISTGVNGSIPGYHNCNELFQDRCKEHTEWSSKFEIHAEMNSILELARNQSQFEKLDFYVTHSPCSNCLKHIMGLRSNNQSINRIVYGELHRHTTKELLTEQKEFCNLFGTTLVSIEELNNVEVS
jgi:dCMP deaminase